MKKLTVAMLAHVDAGKTTLSEALLYETGRIRELGRVDRGSTHLDTESIERERGITVFSKQAVLEAGEARISLLDTPGHVDFSAETERTMQVLDCAVLVISGTDGVQAHTETLWQLLRHYGVPALIFVTKMDLARRSRAELMAEMKLRLGEGCVDFSDKPDGEELAMTDEALMESYLAGKTFSDGDISAAIRRRELFPCFFGSGLKLSGVAEFLDGLSRFAPGCPGKNEFSARVYKIAHDGQGNRLTCVKVTGGSLRTRAQIEYIGADGEKHLEKVSAIRFYSGARFESTDSAECGEICAVLGLTETYPGLALGAEHEGPRPVLEPVMTYRLILPEGTDPMTFLPKLRLLEEEDPQLHVAWNERLGEISLQLMGKIQTEVLKTLISERFGVEVSIDAGRIMYRETITEAVEGVGHYEPLRHYAEVHLLLEPLGRGEGLVFAADCPTDELDLNWQRLVLTHLAEKQHLGVLTGSPITDMKITLKSGRAHVKHTEGGDFRQATYRAVRHGLMRAKSLLLEPYYAFRLEVPAEQIGRAITDVRSMGGEFSAPVQINGASAIVGEAPVSRMQDYAAELAGYTRGRGRLSVRLCGYRECRSADRTVAEASYDPERDLENTPDSVFCAHGGGFTVKWDRVCEYMHLPSIMEKKSEPLPAFHGFSIDDRELEEIMRREFGEIKRPVYTPARSETAAITLQSPKKEYLIIDGYNVIFAWDELKKLAAESLDLARARLLDILSNYRGFTKSEVVLVFDAYRVAGNAGSKTDVHGIHVVYTKEGETGDSYIERLTHDIGKNYSVRVVTSDNLIRLSAMRAGVLRVSSKEFYSEVSWVLSQIDEILSRSNVSAHTTRIDPGSAIKNGK